MKARSRLRRLNGKYRRVGERERRTVPLLIEGTKCQRVSKGNRTRAEKQRAKVQARTAMLQAELGMTNG